MNDLLQLNLTALPRPHFLKCVIKLKVVKHALYTLVLNQMYDKRVELLDLFYQAYHQLHFHYRQLQLMERMITGPARNKA